MVCPRRKPCGFTLIELLVVVAIIALLIGILVPSLSKARETARATHCASGLRQWGFAMSYYLNDYAQFFPQEGAGGSNTLVGAWYNELPPYVNAPKYGDIYNGSALSSTDDGYKNSWIWYCQTRLQQTKNSGTNKNSFHYAMNAVLNGTGTFTPNYSSQNYLRLLSVPEPANTPFMFETDANGPADSPSAGTTNLARARHFGNAFNMLFMDQHVAVLKGADVGVPPMVGIYYVNASPTRITWGPFKN